MKQKPFNREQAVDRTKELQLIKDRRKWTESEKGEFHVLLEGLFEDSRRRMYEEWERRKMKPEEAGGVH